MNYSQVQAQLSILPPVYKNPSQDYDYFINSVAMGLTFYTEAMDALMNQAVFTSAKYNWLKAWGSLFVVPQGQYENSSQYFLHIQEVINKGNSTPVRIQQYIQDIYNVTVVYSENFPTPGYTLTFNGQVSDMQQLAIDLGRIRPAGIPAFPFYILAGGSYLNTINFIGSKRVTGSYLALPITPFTPNVGDATLNAINNLPTNYLTSTAINPNII